MAAVDNVVELKSTRVPGIRVYNVTASDGETFQPVGWTTIEGCIPAYKEDPSTGNPIGYTLSSNVITIECTGATDVVMTIMVFGQE